MYVYIIFSSFIAWSALKPPYGNDNIRVEFQMLCDFKLFWYDLSHVTIASFISDFYFFSLKFLFSLFLFLSDSNWYWIEVDELTSQMFNCRFCPFVSFFEWCADVNACM